MERGDPIGPGQVKIRLIRPCARYASVQVAYGPLVFDEELSVAGTLEVTLPAVAGAAEVTFSWPDGEARLALDPSASASAEMVAVAWTDGVAWGRLMGTERATVQRLGFPQPGARALDVLALDADETPVMTAPVTPETCGQAMRATVLSGPDLRPRRLSVTMPGCDAVGRTLRLALPR